MATNADIGHGTTFERGDGADPEVFTALAEVLSLSFGGSRDAIDATSMDSANRFREYVPGLRDGGEISVELNYDPDGTNSHTALVADLNADAASNYRIVVGDSGSTTLTFTGFLTAFEPGIPNDDKMTATATYKVTGKPGMFT